jgi:hypothetical protein
MFNKTEKMKESTPSTEICVIRLNTEVLLNLSFRQTTNNFLVVIHTCTEKSFVIYLKFKFNKVSCIFIF